MGDITFIHPDGARETFEAPAGDSVMEIAYDEGVEGILAECGGNGMCATCHVYVESPPIAELPAPSIAEDGMLDTTAAPRLPNSRLSCQLIVDEGVFVIPDEQ